MIIDMSEPTFPRLVKVHGHQVYRSQWWDGQGHHRTKNFGRKGVVSEAQVRALYTNWIQNEYGAKPYVRNPNDPKGYTVAVLAEAYKIAARSKYTKNGEVTSHISQVDEAMDALAKAYGTLPASALDNPKVARLRDQMIVGKIKATLSVKTVNGRLFVIKDAMKWARERELVTAVALNDVMAVSPLKAGRCDATPSKKIKPVQPERLAAARAKLPPTVRDMVDIQLLTGMRPGEVCSMRACDIEKAKVWLYRPWTHKTEHHDKARVIPLGPKAQEILAPRIGSVSQPTDFLFTPAAAVAERRAERRAKRKTPLSCGNVAGSNLKSRPDWKPGKAYDAQSYRKAIRHACRAVEKETGEPFPSWHPHQLRHNFATFVRERFDRESVADMLGHAGANLVDVYAERTLKRATKVAKQVG